MGDMQAVYVQDEETGSVELVLLPADTAYEVAYREKPYPDLTKWLLAEVWVLQICPVHFRRKGFWTEESWVWFFLEFL